MRILIVDDSRSSLAMLAHILSDIEATTIETFLDPVEALGRCGEVQFDLVLVDYLMPQMTGVEMLHVLRGRDTYQTVPVIILTSDSDRAIRIEAIAAGATDFINKPFDKIELRARVGNLLALRRSQIELADRATWLAREVQAATRHLVEREEEVIWRLARAMEYRDGGTSEHVSRVAIICKLIAEGLGLPAERCRTIYLAAPLHDIGKIAISDTILGKPGRLSPEETTQMREHVSIGARILEDGTSDLVRVAALIAQHHHEKWDGTGYPAGIAGEAIPLEGRITAIADVFDALCSRRPYKPAWPIEEAYAEILAGSGTHFDPACVRAFEKQWPRIAEIMQSPAGTGISRASQSREDRAESK